jgi:hypothetical protein
MNYASPVEKHIYDLAYLVGRLQGALGTEENGDGLVAVARDAHRAERKLASLERAANLDLILSLSNYVSEDDLELDRLTFLGLVRDRIADDLNQR